MRLILLSMIITFSFSEQRIIPLSPAINEIVYALGAGKRVVANTEHCTYPKASCSVPKVGGYFSVSLEKILTHRPTIVMMQKNNEKLATKLHALGIETKVITIDTLAHIKEGIQSIGSTLHHEVQAKQLITQIDTALQNLKGIVEHKKILIVIGHNTSLVKRIFVAGQNLYFDEIIRASENINAFQSRRKGQPILNMENLIATNPDIVILLAHSKEAYHISDDDLIAPWKKLPISAAKTDSIYILDKPYAGIPSDRLILFLQDFQAILQHYKHKNESSCFK